ncbi:hypothetical protein E2320_006008 [Naja naja]|nr:hypothetical protein E2320_006008 [Naja naja]
MKLFSYFMFVFIQRHIYTYIFVTFTVEAVRSFCHPMSASLSPVNLKNIRLGTTMKCEDHRHCSLHLSVKANLQLNENMSGVEICYLLMVTQKTKCVKVKISRGQNAHPEGNKVKIQFNCFEVSVGQHLYVTMTTIPNYCGVQQTQEYYVEDCRNNDVGKNIPDCFVSKIAYNVDRTRKTVSVNISDVQNTDCYVRLCHQRFVCEDVGPVTLIQGKDLIKSASLQFTQLLPCLCIESLWDNIVYQAVTQTLTWEAACPVHVTVSLCQLMKINGQCVDLEGTVNIATEKFATEHNVWVKCPFSHGHFQAEFSVLVCNRTNLHSCNSTGSPKALSLGGLSLPSVNISGKPCGSDICIKGWRTDVDYSVSSYVCDLPCSNTVLEKDMNYIPHASALDEIAPFVLCMKKSRQLSRMLSLSPS